MVISLVLLAGFGGVACAQKNTAKGEVVTLTAKNFNTETKKGIVVVDFWATWCGPCKLFAPTFKAVAKDFASRAKFAKLDVDNAREIATKYNITAIPCIIIFKNGEEMERLVGYQEKQNLINAVSKYTK